MFTWMTEPLGRRMHVFTCLQQRDWALTWCCMPISSKPAVGNMRYRTVSAGVIPVALPGASLGLGVAFAPARRLLNAGSSLAIASDWNPGSAPMGTLLMQAAILGVYERLTMTETLAAITFRAARALGLNDRGILKPGCLADFIAFPCSDYQEILYNQGGMMPQMVWKRGRRVKL